MPGFGSGRVGDVTAGHGGFSPTPAIRGSISTVTDQIPQVRVGDAFQPHTNGTSVHAPVAAQGGSTRFVDQLPAHGVTHAESCGDILGTGSISTYAGY